MNTYKQLASLVLVWFITGIGLPSAAYAEEQDHDENDQHGSEEIRMTASQREDVGIQTMRVASRSMAETVSAPGEVHLNAYASAQVTPRISAQVVARHVRLGDSVKAGQPLVTLSSVAMAEAQGALIETDREWRRVQQLGHKVIAEKRFIAAQVARQRAYATVRAYGMNEAQIKQLLGTGDASQATGSFELLSQMNGTVIRDDFIVGEVIDPGRILVEISDESKLWVEAQLRPEQVDLVEIGASARVSRNGSQWLDARVVQLHHRLDKATRTQGVRLNISNSSHRLHPGEYVETRVQTSGDKARIAIPQKAILLIQGAPTVFRLEGDELHPQVVESGITRDGWTEIKAGLASGDEIVSQGAFMLKSLALKSQMGEGHGH